MRVYLDNAATTQVDSEVILAMKKYFSKKYANPSSIHFFGEEIEKDLNNSYNSIKKILNAEGKNLVFTGSASEANNLIIKGVARANKDKGDHIIISQIEHPCVLAPAKELSQEGFKVSYLPVNSKGRVKIEELKNMITDKTILVSVMTANNEIGVVQDIEKISGIVKKSRAFFHTDAVQAIPYIDIDVNGNNIDFLTLSAHKFHGPKGVGLAIMSPEIAVKPLVTGGSQNNNLRAGTLNIPGIIGLTKALEISYKHKRATKKKVKELRDYLYKRIIEEIPNVKLNGDENNRLENNLNVRFHGVEGESILMDLSQAKICISTGSACSATNLKTSYVLQALNIDPKYLNSNIRFSLSKYNTKKEIDYTVEKLKQSITRLRKFSPIK
ncbi:cysteine desulfurase [bacterium]|nr:cysteine desulfurase [bacterium]